MTRTKIIGFVAVAVAVLGYGAFAGSVVLGKMDILTTAQVLWIGIPLAFVGEAGLWIAAACLGWTLFKGRKAFLDRLMGRKAAVPPPSDQQAV